MIKKINLQKKTNNIIPCKKVSVVSDAMIKFFLFNS